MRRKVVTSSGSSPYWMYNLGRTPREMPILRDGFRSSYSWMLQLANMHLVADAALHSPRLSASTMAEVAGLALGALGIAGLFTSCVENFDIIVRAKDFGEEFDLLCTQLSLQRIRLAVWGETLGLLPPASSQTRRVRYNRSLEREDIKPSIVASLNQLLNQLTKADTPTGMRVLRDSYRKFKKRIRKNQKQKSVWKVTRWSVHDCAQFEALVDNVRKLMDGLESIANALGVLEKQHERLLEEVESVPDVQSLSLLQDVGSSDSAPAALKAVSDTASVQLSAISSDSQSYYTTRTGQTSSGSGSSGLRQRKLKPIIKKEGLTINEDPNNITGSDTPFEDHHANSLSLLETLQVTPSDISSNMQRWKSAPPTDDPCTYI
ncbi:hypothetical protein PG994_004108 [Apiospora phragmitis]|uniref:Prion-inhibition and propagation HeLo domain-containing protein n=1 Tax=Apiospora phragmitis TaxID=2905665 RepID=A0ABR1VPN5_9PEZI